MAKSGTGFIFGAAVLCVVLFEECAAAEWVWENISRENRNGQAVLIDRGNPDIIYFGLPGAVLKTADGGENWRTVLNIGAGNNSFNFLLSAPKTGSGVYALSGKGLFYSADQGENWKKIFKRGDYLETECTAIGIVDGVIYLGTKKGLFIAEDRIGVWDRQNIGAADKAVLSIAVDPGESYVYAVCGKAVYRHKQGCGLWERVFSGYSAEDNTDGQEDSGDNEREETAVSGAKCIAVDQRTGEVYLAADKKVYKSVNKGIAWEPMPDYGLFDRDIRMILVSSEVYAATKSAIFRFDGIRWSEVSFGLWSCDIRFITSDKQGVLYAVCDNGLFKTKAEPLYSPHNEPDIGKVQRAAIEYAEVEPEKIMLWRRQAAQRAILPSITVGIDRDTSDLLHWESGSAAKTYDDVLVTGKDVIGWDISLSWDLGEIIWNNDQTAIDARSRLMVQLRQDVLDEVTKLYFERIRVKMELNGLSIEERKKRSDKELKLQELTAQLDGLTGGYFSRSIRIAAQ